MVEQTISKDMIKDMVKLNKIHTSWENYCMFLLNTASDLNRDNWRQKFITSKIHWEFNRGSVSENNIIGLEVLSSLPSELTLKVCDDAWVRGDWYRDKRLPGSKRQVVCLGHYPQESMAHEAHMCLTFILSNWEKYKDLILGNDYLLRMWEYAQVSHGHCVTQDEILTYTLEHKTDEMKPAYWTNICDDVFRNGVQHLKYAKEYRSDKLEGYPFAEGEKLHWVSTSEDHKELTLDEMKKNFMDMIDVILKEDIGYSPNYKKIAICVLKGDNFKYAGFSPTLKERQAREKAMMAFSRKEADRQKAIKNMQRLENKKQ